MAEGETKINVDNETGTGGGFSLHTANIESKEPSEKTGKRGRPKGSRNRSRNIEIPLESKNDNRPIKNPDDIEAAKFLGIGLVSLVELAESFVHGSCQKKIAKHIPDKLQEFKEMSAKLGLQKKDGEIIQNSMQAIAMRHEWMTKFAPEVLLCLTFSQYTIRQLHLIKFTNNIISQLPAEKVKESI